MLVLTSYVHRLERCHGEMINGHDILSSWRDSDHDRANRSALAYGNSFFAQSVRVIVPGDCHLLRVRRSFKNFSIQTMPWSKDPAEFHLSQRYGPCPVSHERGNYGKSNARCLPCALSPGDKARTEPDQVDGD